MGQGLKTPDAAAVKIVCHAQSGGLFEILGAAVIFCAQVIHLFISY